MPMDCSEARRHLLDAQRGRLGPETGEALRAHIEGCPSCAGAEAEERSLSGLLERRLPQYPAPIALKRRLSAQWPPPPAAAPSRRERWARYLLPAGAVALLLLLLLPLYRERTASVRAGENMVTEAANDHLRVLQARHPLEVESGNFHQVKPWFAGRLDFAPVVPFMGDAEFPLRGGALAWFLDRKAALFSYGIRLHAASLFVFRAEGLPWPAGGLEDVGKTKAFPGARRGINVILWRSGEQGYALASDADPAELRKLALKVSGGA